MQLLTDWISNIILLILLATILELLLPNSSLQKYVKMVVGLLLLVIILNPLFTIFNHDADSWIADLMGFSNQYEEKDIQISLEKKKSEIQQAQLAYISEQVAVQLKRQVEEEMITKFDMEIKLLDVALNDFLEEEDYLNSISNVSVQLREKGSVVHHSSNDEVEAIQVVSIDTTNQIQKTNQENSHKTEIINFLAKQWRLPIEKIQVEVEGGNENR